MSLYLDANVLVALVVPEPQHPDVDAYLISASTPFVTSTLGRGEFLSAMGRYVRRGEMAPDRANSHVTTLDTWLQSSCEAVPIDDRVIDMAAERLRRFDLGLRMPDAIHLTLADRRGVPLVTLDDRLLRAAEALGIDAVRPG